MNNREKFQIYNEELNKKEKIITITAYMIFILSCLFVCLFVATIQHTVQLIILLSIGLCYIVMNMIDRFYIVRDDEGHICAKILGVCKLNHDYYLNQEAIVILKDLGNGKSKILTKDGVLTKIENVYIDHHGLSKE